MKLSPVVFALAAVCSQAAMANVVTSDNCQPGVRDFTVSATTVVSCLAAGTGNINGNNDQFQQANPGWVLIDASDTSGGTHNGWLTGAPSLNSGLSGTFAINAAAYTTYDSIAIAFKSGEGQADPDWAVFLLADGTLSGNWSISGQQALSHGLLYGRGTPSPAVDVPEPATLALMGVSLIGLCAVRRRKQS